MYACVDTCACVFVCMLAFLSALVCESVFACHIYQIHLIVITQFAAGLACAPLTLWLRSRTAATQPTNQDSCRGEGGGQRAGQQSI